MKARSSSKGFSLPGVAFLLGKCFHVLCLFLASDFLHSNSLPLLSYTFLLLVGSSLLFFAIQRAYLLLPLLTAKHVTPLAVNGSLLMTSLLLSSFGLAHSGPVRALLIECAAECISLLTWTGWQRLSGVRRRGVACIAVALLILLVTPEVSVHDLLNSPATSMLPRVKQAATTVGGSDSTDFGVNAGIIPMPAPGVRALLAAAEQVDPTVVATAATSHSFTFFFLTLSESSVGTLSLVAASALTFLRKGYERKNSKEFGGRKGFHAVSSCAAAVLLFIPTILQLLTAVSPAAAVTESGHELSVWWMLLTLVFLVLFLVVLQFYIDALAQHSDVQLLTKLNLVVSLLCAAAIDWYRQEQRLSVSTLVASLLVFLGIHFLLQPSTTTTDATPSLPVYTSTGKAGRWRAVRAMFHHFMTDKTSFRIFSFLCINFCFMFVELLYGYFSNSLGLISDAGHMLFDCSALAIGLYASYISKNKSNSSMTYGYSRYETLSGYVNGVFLLFIGYFILVESVERLFTPPVIRGESLVIVSALGLCVNLVGLVFFHDFSHGHGGGGHGHSHGGGHGHSHDGGDGEEEEEEKCEDEHHGHSHGGESEEAAHGHAHNHHAHSHAAASSSSSSSSTSAPSHTNHNVLAIYLHILADTLGSVGVICSSLLIQFYGITSADAICSIIISLLIIGSTGPLLTSTLHILLTRTPLHKTKPLTAALATITQLPHVRRINDAHFWLLSDSELIGTAKVEVEAGADEQAVLQRVTEVLKVKKVGVNDLTVEIHRENEMGSEGGGGGGGSAAGGGGGLKPISVGNGSTAGA